MTRRTVEPKGKSPKTIKFQDLQCGDFYKFPFTQGIFFKINVEIDDIVSDCHVDFNTLVQHDVSDCWDADVIRLSNVTLTYEEETK